MQLDFGFNFDNLTELDNLKLIDARFHSYLNQQQPELYKQYAKSLSANDTVNYSELIIALSPFFDDFIAELFCIESSVLHSRLMHQNFDVIYECKKKFIQRFAVKKYSKEAVQNFDINYLKDSIKGYFGQSFDSQAFAKQVLLWLSLSEKFANELDIAARYSAYMVYLDDINKDILFQLPKAIDSYSIIHPEYISPRLNLNYAAPEINLNNSLDQAHYCLYCHKQNKDSCSKGLKNTSKNGCPLEQKISEMNHAKAKGFNLAALAIIMIDNPLTAATGHRICNDCMKACIFQKQEPVDVPLIESEILNAALSLPYGAEIYLLLSMWNPLNIHSPLPKRLTSYKILVVGLGPAGFSLSHYLSRLGHSVVAIESSKLAPLDQQKSIEQWQNYKQELSKRLPSGFGGVAEYGITSRWDKNNLSLIRLMLERRCNYRIYGSTMLDGNLTFAQAYADGFDHIAICTGAGKPKFLNITDIWLKGVRSASDFLMTLQSAGAAVEITNLQVRLPIVVIGGGLTSIDAAVEALLYYPVQVQRFYAQYQILEQKFGEAYLHNYFKTEDKIIAQEFINHAKLLLQDQSDVIGFLKKIGGATIYYRGQLQDSPAFKLNREEVYRAQVSGVDIVGNALPLGGNADDFGHVTSIDFKIDNVFRTIAAKTLLIAIGTDHKETYPTDKISYLGDCNSDSAGSVVKAIASAKMMYKIIDDELSTKAPASNRSSADFFQQMDLKFKTKVAGVIKLAKNIFEITITAPSHSANFKPGQFFKLQNYASDKHEIMKPLALACSKKYGNNLSFVIKTIGKASHIAANLKIGEQVSLMGPTGTHLNLPVKANVTLIGSDIGNAALLAIAQKLKSNNCHITYYGHYTNYNEIFYQNDIESVVNKVIWSSDSIDNKAYVKGNLLETLATTPPPQNGLVICLASPEMMHQITLSRTVFFGKSAKLICGINAPMQCMTKGICGTCVIKGEGDYILTCKNQYQEGKNIDFNNLKYRLEQNSLFEAVDRLILAINNDHS